MQTSQLHRLTIDGDPLVFPCKQAFLDTERNLWWDLHFLHAALCRSGCRANKKDWTRWCKGVLAHGDIPPACVLYCRNSSTPEDHIANVCSTSAKCMLLWSVADVARQTSTAMACALWVKTAANRAGEVTTDTVTLACLGGALTVTRHGRLEGLCQLLGKPQSHHGVHTQQVDVLKTSWDALHREAILGEAWEQDTHRVVDVVHFAMLFSRTRRSQSRAPLPPVTRFMKLLRNALVQWIAAGMEKYFFEVYSSHHDVAKPAPSYHSAPAASRGDGAKRRYVQVNPEVAWDMMEQARNTGASLRQIIKVRRTDDHVGCATSSGESWVRKLQSMYTSRRAMCLGPGVNHINAIADPATHSKKEAMVLVFWSWENQVGAYGDMQWLAQAKTVLSSEQEMPQNIADLAATLRLERVSAFRQLQAYGNAVRHLTGGEKQCISSFRLPEGVHAHPVREHEVRVVGPAASRAGADPAAARAVIVNTQTGTMTQALPDDLEEVSLLVLGLDQGSIGSAGIAYANHLCAMIHCKFDKLHRVIRDVKLALQHACGGLFLKTQLYSTYVWSVNYKPYGTGAFGTQKTWLLNTFLATHDCESELFEKYACKIAEDFGMPPPAPSRGELEAVWCRLCTLNSFTKHADIVKLGRWFSWNSAAHSQMCEFHAAKMLYEAFLKDSANPDSDEIAFDDLKAAASRKSVAADLRKLRSAGGGLALAWRLMSSQLLQCVKILYVVTRGCWSWYTAEVKEVKTPHQGLRSTLAASQGKWASSPHLQQTIHDSLYNLEDLRFMGIDVCVASVAAKKPAQQALMLMLHVLRNRVWSLAARHHNPPEAYVGVFSPSPHRRAEVMESMERHWKNLTQLEQRRFASPMAKRLRDDLTFANNMPVRMMFMFFERSGFPRHARCSAGIKILRGMLEVLPDNKIVEYIHSCIRQDSKTMFAVGGWWDAICHCEFIGVSLRCMSV